MLKESPRELALASALAIMVGIGCSDNPENSGCPDGYESSQGRCFTTPEYLDELTQTIGTGVYGYALTVTGACTLDLNSGPCIFTPVSNLEISVYRFDDIVDRSGGATCPWRFEVNEGVEAVVTMRADNDGRYSGSVGDGRYAITAIDPVDLCPYFTGTAEINEQTPLSKVLFRFEHGGE